jgi:hypothetical protein
MDVKLAKLIILLSLLTIILTPCALYMYNAGYAAGQDNMAATWLDGCLKDDVNLDLFGIKIHCGVVKAL